MPSQTPVTDPNIRSRTAFIDNSVPGVFKPVPWHLVEYAFQGTSGDAKVRELWEMVDIDLGAKGRRTNKVVTRLMFINPDTMYLNRISPENSFDRNRKGVNGGSGPLPLSRTI